MANPVAPMGIAVMGMMRSGTTLVSDLLTIRGKSLVISEPNMLGLWNAKTVSEIGDLCREFGLEIPPPPEPPPSHIFKYFDKSVLPALAELDIWGAKYVDLRGWQQVFQRYKPKKMVLCVRDLRDVVLSALELTQRMGLTFVGGKDLRDEAWLFARVCYTVNELLSLRRQAHFVVRYEDLVDDPSLRTSLADYVGLERLGEERLNLEKESDSRSRWERRKHGDDITKKALGRFEREPEGPMRHLAERLWRLLGEYNVAFDYDVAPPKRRLTGHPFAVPKIPTVNSIVYEKLRDADWLGPLGYVEPAFSRRRARKIAARNIPPDAHVLDLGGGIAGLRTRCAGKAVVKLADIRTRAPGVATAQLLDGELPPKGDATHIVAIDFLEYAPRPARLLRALRRYELPVLIAYPCADDLPDLDRSAYGWRNSLTRQQLMAGFAAVGFKVAALWAFDRQQSFFKLRPVAPGSATATATGTPAAKEASRA